MTQLSTSDRNIKQYMRDARRVREDLSPRIITLRERLRGRGQIVEGVKAGVAKTPPYLGSEPFHEAWCANEDAPFTVRLARALAAWRASVQPELVPGHLILGTPPPRTAVRYGTGTFVWDFIIDEELVNERAELRDVANYWLSWKQTRSQPILPPRTSDSPLGNILWMVGIGTHSTQDYSLALEGGLDGLRERVKAARRYHPESSNWYEALLITLDGIARYILAHAEAAEREAKRTDDGQAVEWQMLAANCRHIATAKPETFHQAVQLFYFLFLLNGHDSPGRMDQYLWPALRRELAAGTLTLESAQEIVDCLYLKLAEHVCYGATLGGQLPEGGDATNVLTWLCLHSIRRLRLLSPRTALRWHRDTPKELFAATIHSIATGATFPVLVNDEVMLPSLIRRGVREEHARDYTFCGCGQTIPSGRAYGGYEDLMLNSVKPLTLALHEGRDEWTGHQAGVITPPVDELDTFESLEEAVWSQMTHLLKFGIETTNAWRRWGAKHVPDFLRSMVTHSCVERGRDWRAGGADYHEGMVDLVGFTTLVDSLMVVKRFVYEDRRLSLSRFVQILDENWNDSEALRLDCLNGVAKFGNEDAEVDDLFVRWLQRVNDWLFCQQTAFGGPWGVDIIGWSGAMIFGNATGATPDGRRAGESLADCAGPAQGRDRSGITAVLNSMLKIPMREIHGPLALSLRAASSDVASPEGEAKLLSLVETYLHRGGQHLQITVASTDEMREAQREPEKHRDLVVRVGGFSAYFVELDQRFQDDMIRRTEYSM